MALPTLTVTPGTGTTVNTLPPGGQALGASSLPVIIATDQSAVPADTVIRAVATDRGGTIATGGTAQQMMAANANRRGYSVQNQSTGDLYINALAAATIDYHSLKIPAGSLYESPPTHVGPGAISIIGATTGQAWYSREF